jgi:hypothetical protein
VIPKRRSRQEHGTKALGCALAKAVSQRLHDGHQPKDAAWASTHVSVSLECNKVVS